ncbi:hypothetical protein IYX23_15810 [Methylocystis sp. L43]|uniref:hypothetical protein n=1 Tax=Methylocystis sp. L43 TaxID=2785790 RepID=UPI0018C30969|nr:hypothetical protein [Methylocystis sp. L43]MBG0799137.1 hypothetical protein [Methylocystis sp. L43]MBG0806487.1 hypothetical protein [Methylocystis sp. H15]
MPPRDNETLRSEWTIAALQKRFAALEQRLAAVEQSEEERRRSDLVEAAARARREEEQEQIVLGTSTDTAPDQSQAQWQEVEQPQFVQAEVEPREAEAILHAHEQVFERNAPEIAKESQGYKSRFEVHPARRRGIFRTMVYRFVSVVITALIAAAIGFGIAIFTVPIEKATQFHTYVNRALDGLHNKYRVERRTPPAPQPDQGRSSSPGGSR